MKILQIDQLFYRYSPDNPLLENLSLTLEKGEVLWLAGHNGSGKSTLMKLLMGLLKPQAGGILLNQVDISNLGIIKRAGIMGLAMQNPDLQLFASSLEEELSFGPNNLGWPQEKINPRISQAKQLFSLQNIGNGPPLMQTFAVRKRIGLAAIDMMDPQIYLLDEPDWSMDRSDREMLSAWIDRETEQGKTFIIVSHNREYMAEICHSMVLLRRGAPCGWGRVDQMIYQEQPWIDEMDLTLLAKEYLPGKQPLSPSSWIKDFLPNNPDPQEGEDR
ncbi:MAG: ABC transporter ATP-binding protein [Spirochaetaceae bacterium]|jgi:energy-coupling factor transporter ATP-binding protein EcfA2|nr:ABC transporter ATP-binding protein [Spirochaetaceae bacterium]